MSQPFGRRLLGLTMEDNPRPIYEPRRAHSITYAAAGGWKTSAGSMTWLLSMLADSSRGMVITDSKDGEMAAQVARLCSAYGRKVVMIDDFNVFGADNPYRIELNPKGSLSAAYEEGLGELLFSAESANYALIEEPKDGDEKNRYWRSSPRGYIEFAQRSLLRRNPRLATPGGAWSLLADPETFNKMLDIETEEGDQALKARARNIINMRGNVPDHHGQHIDAALGALRIFEAGSALHDAGRDAETTHLDLLRDNAIVFLIAPQRHMERLGAYYALHLQSFQHALLTGLAGPTDFILEEANNTPIQSLISKTTVVRAFGGAYHFVSQSRKAMQTRFGEKLCAIAEEMAIVKQYFGFSDFEEAERVSKAMGQSLHVGASLNVSSERLGLSGGYQAGLERVMTADELMRLPDDEQIIHVKGVGWIHCKKIRQNEIAPYCHALDDNPLEGGKLPPDPKVTLNIRKKGEAL